MSFMTSYFDDLTIHKKNTKNFWVLIPANMVRRKRERDLLQVKTYKNQKHHNYK